MSSAYDSLDPRVRKWVYKQGWSTLRPLQESSIPAILARDRDVLISAGTAAGKNRGFLSSCLFGSCRSHEWIWHRLYQSVEGID